MPHSNRVANVRGWESRGRDGTLRSRYDSLKAKRDGQTDRQTEGPAVTETIRAQETFHRTI